MRYSWYGKKETHMYLMYGLYWSPEAVKILKYFQLILSLGISSIKKYVFPTSYGQDIFCSSGL